MSDQAKIVGCIIVMMICGVILYLWGTFWYYRAHFYKARLLNLEINFEPRWLAERRN